MLNFFLCGLLFELLLPDELLLVDRNNLNVFLVDLLCGELFVDVDLLGVFRVFDVNQFVVFIDQILGAEGRELESIKNVWVLFIISLVSFSLYY